MPKIRELDPITVNRIAAGEVIDRPSSVVKELLENSLDAGATEIIVDIENGGKDLIRVADNGSGIEKDDLIKAPIRHATSKISSLDDIYSSLSYGFRGEALASIASAGHLRILSNQDGSNAYQVHVDDTTISQPELSSRSQGTTVECQSLFHKIPVRQRFLKTRGTETSHIYDVVLQYALLRPEVDFVLSSDGTELLNTRGISDYQTLFKVLFDKKSASHVVEVNERIGDISFSGYISDPTLTYSNRQKQIIGVNGRAVKSQVLSKAIQTAYKDIIPQRRFPLIVLSIHIPQDYIDVNIHPQKLDIKFLNPGALFDSLPKVVQITLQKASQEQAQIIPQKPTFQSTSIKPAFTNTAQDLPQVHNVSIRSDWKSDVRSTQNLNLKKVRSDEVEQALFIQSPVEQLSKLSSQSSPQRSASAGNDSGDDRPLEYLHMYDTYIVIKGPEAMWILDQHAVHERILYERIKDTFGNTGQRQKLLIAEHIPLSPNQFVIFEDYKAYFESLNFVIEEFGSDQVVVREIPVEFSNANIQSLFKTILEQLQEFPDSTANLTLEMKESLQMKACKAAIKAGKKMAEEEIRQLVLDFINSPSNFTCPHGRPLFIKLAKSDFEKLFLRT